MRLGFADFQKMLASNYEAVANSRSVGKNENVMIEMCFVLS